MFNVLKCVKVWILIDGMYDLGLGLRMFEKKC